jgi:hypothetical protein
MPRAPSPRTSGCSSGTWTLAWLGLAVTSPAEIKGTLLLA